MGGRTLGKQEMIALLEPTLQALGYDLVDIDLRVGGHGLLRLYIDHDPPVTLDDCELVSEQVGAYLDVEDPLPGAYVLEVSSPGPDRRLRTAGHFHRYLGERVRLELRQARDGRRRYTGRLASVEGDKIGLETDDGTIEFDLSDLAQARLVPAT